MQQLSPAALASGDQPAHRCDGHGNQQAPVPKSVDGNGPKQGCHGHPDQAAAGPQTLRQDQRRWNEHRQRTDRALEPEFGHLHQQQQAQGQQGLAHLQSRLFATHHQQHDSAGSQRLGEASQPDQRSRFASHQTEVIEHIKGLGADRFAFARDQIPLANVDGGDPLLGELLFDQLLAEVGISAQIAAALQAAHQHLHRQRPGWCRGHRLDLQLQGRGLPQLIHGKAADQSLAEHPFGRVPHLLVPGEALLIGAALQPDLFGGRQIHGPHPSALAAVRDLLQLAQLPLQAQHQLPGLLGIDHLHH